MSIGFEGQTIALPKLPRWIIKNDTLVVAMEGQRSAEISFAIDAMAAPKHFDQTITFGGRRLPPVPGIYKLDGDTLTVCTVLSGKSRPTAFEALAGSGRNVSVLQRVKEESRTSAGFLPKPKAQAEDGRTKAPAPSMSELQETAT